MKKLLIFAIIPALAILTFACARSYTIATEREIAELNEKFPSHRIFYLASSMYYGVFWKDSRYYYVTPYVPASLTYLSSPTGKNIPPPPHIGILAAGTPVKIQEVQFPTAAVVNSRVLMTPRYYPWVYLDIITPERSLKAVLVIPAAVKEPPAAIERKIQAHLLDSDPKEKLDKLTKEERDAIWRKEAFVGMTIESAEFALGAAPEIKALHHGKNYEVLWTFYDGRKYYFENGILTKIE
ncbi:MAG: hypothetical protein Kow0090_20910 [Myxococcota bacterium]